MMAYLLREEEYTRLTHNQAYIRENMDADFMIRVMDNFYQMQHVTYNIRQDFEEMTRTSEKAEAILDMLLGGTSYRYEAFCDFCKDEHPEMFERLFISDYSANEDDSLSVNEDTGDGSVIREDLSVASLPTRCRSPPACLQNLGQLSPQMDINVIPVVSQQVLSKLGKTKSVYSCSFPVRGVALLFINIEFTDRDFPRRDGAEHDLDNVSRLFHKLNYNVKVIRNATRSEVLKELDFQRRNRMHRNFGSFVLGFSTHRAGNKKAITCADGNSIYIQDIYQHFDSRSCPYLAGKPKFIFFDASFGRAEDRAVRIDKILDPPKHFKPVKRQLADIRFSLGNIKFNSREDVTRVSPDDMVPACYSASSISNPSCTIADTSDFIIAMSTFDGYVNWRRNSHGCWFSRIMVEVFQKYACDCDLVKMLKIVRQKMSCIQTNSGCKQVNTTIDTTLKQFYFFPGVTKASG